ARPAEPREGAAPRRAPAAASGAAPPRPEGHEGRPACGAGGAVVLRGLDVVAAEVDARVRGLEEGWERQLRELEERLQGGLLRVGRAEHAIGCHGRSLEESAATLQVHAERLQSAENSRESAPPWYAQLESAVASLERRAEEGRAGAEVEQQRLRLALESVRRRSGEALLGLRGEMEARLKAELGHLAARLEEGMAELSSTGPAGRGASLPPASRHELGGHELGRRLDDAEARLASLRERVEAQDGRLAEVTERLERARVERLRHEEADLEADCRQQLLQQRVAALDGFGEQLTRCPRDTSAQVGRLDNGLGRLQEGPQYAEKGWVERQLLELRAHLDDGLGLLQEGQCAERTWAEQQLSELRSSLEDGLERLREGPQDEGRASARAALRASLGDGPDRLGLGHPQLGPHFAERAWAEQHKLSELKASPEVGPGPLPQASELGESLDRCAERAEELASCALNGGGQGCQRQMLELEATVADQAQQIEALTETFLDAIARVERTLQGVAAKVEGWGGPSGPLEALTERVASLQDALGLVRATDALERRLLELEAARAAPAAEAPGRPAPPAERGAAAAGAPRGGAAREACRD
ncbi:unnamed protein product, partial [Prorocentrum cordatum]